MRATVLPMDHRPSLDEPQNKSIWSRMELLFGLVPLLACTALVLVYLPRSSYFKVQRVLFENVNMIDEEAILAASKIHADDNVLFLDADTIEHNVETLPYVKRCEVKRMYPNELLLRIMKREAVATILVNNHLFEVDREYVVLRELSPFAIHTGPLITNLPEVVTLQPGVKINRPELTEALKLWEVFQTLPFSENLTLSELSAENEDTLRMFFEELPYEMRWGRSDYATQADRLAILWDEMGGIIPCECYLDLRFDRDLACR